MQKVQVSDHELVREFMNGKQSCLQILIDRHKDKVFTYILMMVKDEHLAEDLFQDTFIKVLHSLNRGKYQENGKFVSWVVRIAHNLIIDHFRKAKQLRTYSNDNYEGDLFNSKRFAEATIEEQMVEEQIHKNVKDLIELLPEEQKQVVLLRHYVGLSFKEIAEHTGVSINTALGRMRYALINLRRTAEEKNMTLTAS